jgi:Phospholipid methyltransferase
MTSPQPSGQRRMLTSVLPESPVLLSLNGSHKNRSNKARGCGGVLNAAGYRNTLSNRFVLLTAVAVATLAVIASRLVLVEYCHWNPLAVQLGYWTLWLAFVAVGIPLKRGEYLRRNPWLAYRWALRYQVIPAFAAITAINSAPAQLGVWNFARTGQLSQLGITSIWNFLAAVLITGIGAAIMVSSVVAIGLPAAAFAEEYCDTPPPHTIRGAFCYIRHPIAIGGMIIPAAAAIAGGSALQLWLINIAMLVPYGIIEDHRLRTVFNGINDNYMSDVGRFIPRVLTVRTHTPTT